MDAERIKHAIQLCSALRHAAPSCFHLLYESDMHCTYAWEPRLRRHPITTTADVASIVEICGNDEACICKKLMEITDD